MSAPPGLCIPHDESADPRAGAEPAARARHLNELCGWLMSSFVHASLLIALALILLPEDEPVLSSIVVRQEVADVEISHDEFRLTPIESPDQTETDVVVDLSPVVTDAAAMEPIAGVEPSLKQVVPQTPELPLLGNADVSPLSSIRHDSIRIVIPRRDGGGWDGRQADKKADLLKRRGGNDQSEGAVLRGLRWLVAHQHEDGSWWFNHQHGRCAGQCRHPGDFESTTASTALALLPFFGAGYTQLEGEFKDSIHQALYYLSRNMYLTERGGDFSKGACTRKVSWRSCSAKRTL